MLMTGTDRTLQYSIFMSQEEKEARKCTGISWEERGRLSCLLSPSLGRAVTAGSRRIWKIQNVKFLSLWNRNYFLLFRFLSLKRYGSGSDFWKSYGSGSYFWKVPVPVPVPAPHLDHKKQIFQEKFWIFFSFLHSKLFYKEKVYKF